MDWLNPEYVFSLAMGLGLSAACGFRVFVPLTLMSLMANMGWFTLPQDLLWAASPLALIMLVSATILEIGAYYIPWLDNALDTIATPLAVVAGALVTFGFAPQMSPLAQWSLALIAGGGLAGLTQGATVATRAISSVSTGGLGNPVVSTIEAMAAVGLSLLALLFPLLAVGFVLALGVWGSLKIRRYRQHGRKQPSPLA